MNIFPDTIPLIYFIIFCFFDNIFTYLTITRFVKRKKISKEKAINLEVNPLARFLYKKIGNMVWGVMFLLSSAIIFIIYISANTFLYGMIFGAYILVIGLHLDNLRFLENYKKLDRDLDDKNDN